ncbi:MAG: hypothetical protein H7X80_00545, partial [bacterium]|nr:hypothetical protein [Candidatus Kapabacteria bacterium]
MSDIFDEITRAVANGIPRRAALRMIVTAALTALFGGMRRLTAAQPDCGCPEGTFCCDPERNLCCRNDEKCCSDPVRGKFCCPAGTVCKSEERADGVLVTVCCPTAKVC